MIDEASRRRPGASGVPVMLGDGKEWLLPRPVLGFAPEFGEDGSVRFGEKPVRSFGPAYDALVDAFVETDDGVAEANALLALAVDLLRRNYTVSPADLVVLLPRWFGDEANAEMWREIAGVALGRAPKPTPAG